MIFSLAARQKQRHTFALIYIWCYGSGLHVSTWKDEHKCLMKQLSRATFLCRRSVENGEDPDKERTSTSKWQDLDIHWSTAKNTSEHSAEKGDFGVYVLFKWQRRGSDWLRESVPGCDWMKEENEVVDLPANHLIYFLIVKPFPLE